MLTETKDINWVETLAQIAEDKGWAALGAHIRTFNPDVFPPAVFHYTSPEVVEEIAAMVPIPVDYSGLSDHFSKPTKVFNITKMPEATCDGCQ